MNHLVFIKRQLYILKRQYGNPLDIYSTSEMSDLTTGIKIVTKSKISIKRAIILPISLYSQGIYNQSYMKNIGREYAYGNILGIEIKKIIIDAKDLPKDFEFLPQNNYIVFENARYELLKVEKLEKNFGYEIDIKRLLGVPVYEIFNLNITQGLRIIQRQQWI